MRKPLSCPTGMQLNVWVGTAFEEEHEFEMIEESNETAFHLNDDILTNETDKDMEEEDQYNMNADLNHAKPSLNKQPSNISQPKIKGCEIRRMRSQSENITACTIFKFLENRTFAQN